MNKLIFVLTFLLFTNYVKAQCDTTDLPPIRVIFDMKMNTKYFDYYDSTGTILWKRQLFDSTLIPVGGYARRITTDKKVEGYAVFKVVDKRNCFMGLIRWMDLNMKDLDGTVKYYEFKR